MSELQTGRVASREGSALLRSEDYWAIWTGGLFIVLGALLYYFAALDPVRNRLAEIDANLSAEQAPYPTLARREATRERDSLRARDEPLAKAVAEWISKPKGWRLNPLDSLYMPASTADARTAAARARLENDTDMLENLRAEAQAADAAARNAGFLDASLNARAERLGERYLARSEASEDARKKTLTKSRNEILELAVLGVGLAIVFALGVGAMTSQAGRYLRGFAFVYLLAVVAYVIEAQADIKALGIGYAAWAILLGLLVSNTVGTPAWVRPALVTEFFIKTGLVLLGCEILFGKVLAIGLPGIFVAWVVTPIVLVATYWFGQKILKIASKELNVTLSADMSVCGVSAAIATAAACGAKNEELTLAIGISLVFTSIMMVVMPNVILALDMNHVLGGAWIGGTIDATGAVAAAGAFLSDEALYVAATIKMIQNILIGLIAFGVAVYWTTRVETAGGPRRADAREIWNRFPKFVLGFLGASILFSLVYENLGETLGTIVVSEGIIGGWTKSVRGWCFCLAFVSIGLSTDFRELGAYFSGGKPVVLYLCGQGFNLAFTLLVAYFMFFLAFPQVAQELGT